MWGITKSLSLSCQKFRVFIFSNCFVIFRKLSVIIFEDLIVLTLKCMQFRKDQLFFLKCLYLELKVLLLWVSLLSSLTLIIGMIRLWSILYFLCFLLRLCNCWKPLFSISSITHLWLLLMQQDIGLLLENLSFCLSLVLEELRFPLKTYVKPYMLRFLFVASLIYFVIGTRWRNKRIKILLSWRFWCNKACLTSGFVVELLKRKREYMIFFVFLLCYYRSNVAAGKLFGIPLRGTHSHAFVSSFMVSLV